MGPSLPRRKVTYLRGHVGPSIRSHVRADARLLRSAGALVRESVRTWLRTHVGLFLALGRPGAGDSSNNRVVPTPVTVSPSPLSTRKCGLTEVRTHVDPCGGLSSQSW
jgi:hypothetical protein